MSVRNESFKRVYLCQNRPSCASAVKQNVLSAAASIRHVNLSVEWHLNKHCVNAPGPLVKSYFTWIQAKL